METIVIKVWRGLVEEVYSTKEDIRVVIVDEDNDFDEDIDGNEQPAVELPTHRIY